MKKVPQSTDRPRDLEIIFHKTAGEKNADRIADILDRLRCPLLEGFRSGFELNEWNKRASIAWDYVFEVN